MSKLAINALYAGAATFVVATAGFSLAFAAADMKITQAQCGTLWTEALAGGAGDLSMDLAKPYVKDFKTADRNADMKLSQTEWTDACKQGWVHSSSSSGASDGTSGSPDKTSDRTPGDSMPSRSPGATNSGAGGTDAGQTTGGTSDRTPNKQ